ncbi:MAG TPA: hypothetical protein VLB84_13835, partial [Bacteroidia bacterium]|nr:hypothetical protein [Bacteroidia bacterium]
MLLDIKQRPFNELKDYPNILYKYRSWNDKWHKTILTNQAVYLSRPSKFEDKLDCKSIMRYDLLTPTEIYNKYYNLSKKTYPNLDELDHRKNATREFLKSPMFDQNHIRICMQEYLIDFDDRFGVLSLTADNTNPSMWKKYSDDHKGFCV